MARAVLVTGGNRGIGRAAAQVEAAFAQGAFRVARRASRAMLRAPWGRLVFLSSVDGGLGMGH